VRVRIPRCELPDYDAPLPAMVTDLLRRARTIAVVGLSPKDTRDSHRVARYLMDQGYTIVPVNPGQKEILGRTCYRSLMEIPFPVDLVDVFMNPSRVEMVVAQSIEKGFPAIWLQLGVVHLEAARKAMNAGIQVVMDRCIMTDHMSMAA
jgi:predicted CoA-binding protein